MSRETFTLLMTAPVALLLTSLGASAQEADQQTNWPMSAAVQTVAGQEIPAGAYGVAYIDAPRVATLLQLRGVTGRGTVIVKSDDSHDCLTIPIRFVAGDFGGEGISTSETHPIRLILRSRRVAGALAAGDDVVSDMYRVSAQMDDPEADIIIESGLSESHGFVLNPGRSVVADIFGAATSRTACSELQAQGS
ncbi:hypothetical protein SAMN04488117_108150 [Celeribacter baekdonensis]|uniref:Uncharacterized protein n=1 Tax=Celeribacter baekdonensis TaxID=875171 RepID=A0A1G7PVB5_9RHOB|nr:hypothetical protein [Celeribacter baekdonensis]SDF89569.1 hypothetical protein SAMN04488117_108150 [Celeribacter baekdonensis]